MGQLLADRGDLHDLVRIDVAGQRVAVFELEGLGDLRGDPEDDAQVAGDGLTAHRDGRGVGDRAVVEHGEVGGVTADIDQRHAELPVLVAQVGLGGRERGEDQLVDLDSRPLDAFGEVLDPRLGRGDDVGLHLEPDRGHADRIADALLAVDHVSPGDHVQDLACIGHRHRSGGVDGPQGVLAGDVPAVAGHGDHAARVLRADVVPRDADEGRSHLEPREPLRSLDRGRDGLDRAVDVDDDTLPQSVGGRPTEADDVDAAGTRDLADQHADLRRPDVDGDQDGLLSHQPLLASVSPAPHPGRRSQEVAPDDGHILEYPPAESE